MLCIMFEIEHVRSGLVLAVSSWRDIAEGEGEFKYFSSSSSSLSSSSTCVIWDEDRDWNEPM